MLSYGIRAKSHFCKCLCTTGPVISNASSLTVLFPPEAETVTLSSYRMAFYLNLPYPFNTLFRFSSLLLALEFRCQLHTFSTYLHKRVTPKIFLPSSQNLALRNFFDGSPLPAPLICGLPVSICSDRNQHVFFFQCLMFTRMRTLQTVTPF